MALDLLNVGDSRATTKAKLDAAFDLMALPASGNTTEATDTFNDLVTDYLVDPLPGLTDGMDGGTARSRINAAITALNNGGGGVLYLASPDALDQFRAVQAAGERNVRIAVIGNSTDAGQATGGGTGQAVNSWPNQLADLINTDGGYATANGRFGDSGSYGLSSSMANLILGDGRVSYAGAWALGGLSPSGGNAFAPTAAGTMTLEFPDGVNEYDLWWRMGGAGRSFSYSVDGGPATTLTSSGSNAWTKTTINAGTVDIHEITLAWVAGSPSIWGVLGRDNTQVGFEIYNLGISGRASDSLSNNADPVFGRLGSLKALAPDLTIIEGGILNDMGQEVGGPDLATAIATTKANLTAIHDAAALSGSVLFRIPNFDNRTNGFVPEQEQYVSAMYDLTRDLGAGLLNTRRAWGSYAQALADGLMSDSVHPSAAGYLDIAKQIKRALF